MKRHFKNFLPWVAIAIGILLVLKWLFPGNDTPPRPRSSDGGQETMAMSGPRNKILETAARDRPEERTAVPGKDLVAQRLREVVGSLRSSVDPEVNAQTLAELRKFLLAADPAVAVEVITGFLNDKEDVSTRLPFVVNGEGALDSWPTLRVFLLDVLPSLDPAVALDLSRKVMDAMFSPDEYALALRNLSWSVLDGDLEGEFRQRFERMISEKPWLESPSAGFLEALDAAVRIGDASAFESMIRVNSAATSGNNTPLARAAFMALDRMVERDPAMLGRFYQKLTDGAVVAPRQRASLMSRLDISDSEQRKVFTDYLAHVSDAAELGYFEALFPNGNHLHGGRLFSIPPQPVSIAGRLEKDRGVLTELGKLDFSTQPDAQKSVDRIRARLTAWIAEGDAAE